MQVMTLRAGMFGLVILAAASGTARAQGLAGTDLGRAAAAQPPAFTQPVPGAMPGSQAVPSTLSAKNAADDALPIAAYTFKNLTDDQRRAIYQVITGKALNATPSSAATAAEVSKILPGSVTLSAIPGAVTAQVPQTAGYQYARAGDKLLLVAPVNRVVVGVIAP